MIPFAAEASQSLLDLELAAVAWLLRSVPFGALALLFAVALAVSWLSWSETRAWQARHRHA